MDLQKGGTPDSKTEEGPRALRTHRNTAFVQLAGLPISLLGSQGARLPPRLADNLAVADHFNNIQLVIDQHDIAVTAGIKAAVVGIDTDAARRV